jgi:hypothetical protein
MMLNMWKYVGLSKLTHIFSYMVILFKTILSNLSPPINLRIILSISQLIVIYLKKLNKIFTYTMLFDSSQYDFSKYQFIIFYLLSN